MAKTIHLHIHDGFEESKHPRAKNGQFGSGGGKSTGPHLANSRHAEKHKQRNERKEDKEFRANKKWMAERAAKEQATELEKKKKAALRRKQRRKERYVEEFYRTGQFP